MSRRVAIIGLSTIRPVRRRHDVTFYQLAYDAAKGALDEAGVTRDDVDCFLFCTANENFNRQPLIFATVAEALGLSRKPLMTFSEAGGSSGAAIGVAHALIASGQADLVLAVGGDKTSDADVPGHPGFNNIIIFGCDNLYEVPLGMQIGQFPLLCQAYMSTFGITEEQAAKVSVKNHGNAMLNPDAQSPRKLTVEDVLKSPMLAYPIKFFDCSLISDLYQGVVFASEDKVKELKVTPIWLDSWGLAVDSTKLGYREVMNPGTKLCHPQCLRNAALQAYKMAGITNPRKEIDVAEIQDGFTWLELITYEMLGFCGEGEGGRFIDEGIPYLGGELPVNPSGGCIGFGHGYGGAGLLTLAKTTQQLRGECGDYQVRPIPRTGLAESMGGSGMSVAAVQILRRD
jgi:acetyl-CoA C-acetyltransferase